jgi:hypothetical protein
MSYIKKNTEPLINLKLTDLGRKNLANGKLSFETFQLGDSEIDYSSSDLVGLNILRPVDNQHDIQYPISPDGNNSKIPISNITGVKTEVFVGISEVGFFDNNNNIPNSYMCIIVSGITGGNVDNNIDIVCSASGETKSGDLILIKTRETLPKYYTYVIQKIDDIVYSGDTAMTTGTTYNLELDRNIIDNIDFDGYIISNDNMLSHTDIWKMNIISIDDIIGLDSLSYKGKTLNESNKFSGTAVCYDYLLNRKHNRLGVIYYDDQFYQTENIGENKYGEGFYQNTFMIKFPHLMWHKKQFQGVGTANDVGYTFISDSELKFMGVNNSIRYYDLVDQEVNKTVVGKVLIDEKIVLIDDQELLVTLSYKSNRNWTLPTPKLTLTDVGTCVNVSKIGALEPNEILHVSYILLNDNDINGLHCENYASITNNNDINMDVVFEFPKDINNTDYTEFSYLGTGFTCDSIALIWQKTPINVLPDPTNWRHTIVNDYIGTTGCVDNIQTTIFEDISLNYHDTIIATGTTDINIVIPHNLLGDPLIMKNGVLISDNNFDVNKLTNEFEINISEPHIIGDYFHIYYLRGNSQVTTSEKESVPITGDTHTYTYTLAETPKNGVVYVFKNGIILDRNYYDVNIKEVDFHILLSSSDVITFYYLNSSIPMDNYLLNNLKVNINKGFLDNSVNNIYDLDDYIKIDNKTDIYGHTFGDEVFLMGNISTNIKSTIYKSMITCNVLPNRFITSYNPTFNPINDKVCFSELGIYDENEELVLIGKFSQPLVRNFNSDMMIIQATIDF